MTDQTNENKEQLAIIELADKLEALEQELLGPSVDPDSILPKKSEGKLTFRRFERLNEKEG